MPHLPGYVIPGIARGEEVSERLVGGKGWNLFRLCQFGFSIPTWCIISSALFDEVMASQRNQIDGIIKGIDFTNQNSIDDASSRLRTLVARSELPEEFSIGLQEALRGMFGEGALLSVRSSVVGEDSASYSFAGLMDSFLNVHAEAVIDAIKKVWASAFSLRAMTYRQRKGLSLTNISAAVIIQRMVQSVSSGVIFTRSPESLLEQCVISAGFGLGEGVVANIVETDTYRISFDLKEISKEKTVKNRRVVRDKRGGTQIEAVPDELKSMQVLTDEQIRQLAGDAVKIEKSFGVPQDIEWAFDESGRLFILQARPIVIRLQKGSVEVRVWDNSNIIEGYPGITLPLTFSFIRKGYETLFRNASLGFLFSKKDIKRDLHIFKNMVGLLQGRVYYNLLNWYRMMSYLPGFKKYKESWDQMIGITEKLDFPESNLSPVNHLYAITMVIWRLLGIKRTARKFYAIFNSVYDRFKNMELSVAGEDELIALYNSLEQELLRKWHLTLYNDFCAIKYYDWLKKLCCMWGLQGSRNLHNDLLVGEYGVESVSPVHSLIRTAAMIGADPAFIELFSEDDDQVIWEKILTERAYGAIKTALEEHLQAFGDRGVEELKLEKPSFREEPALLIRIIKNYYQLALSEEKMEVQKQEIRAGAETIIRQRLKTPFKRLLFWFVLRNARLAIANRENMRFDRSRLFGIVRRLFQRMGELFAEKGVLEAETDIYYLTVEEVFGFVEGAAVTQDLKALVKLRKAEYTEFAGYNLKERIRTVGSPYLNPLSEGETSGVEGKTLKGIGCSSGVVKGTAKVVLDPASTLGGGNYILVARSTDPGWVFLMIASKGILVERGSLLSHTAIIGRELGIPTIVGVKDATKLIPDGALLFMDGGTGEVRWR